MTHLWKQGLINLRKTYLKNVQLKAPLLHELFVSDKILSTLLLYSFCNNRLFKTKIIVFPVWFILIYTTDDRSHTSPDLLKFSRRQKSWVESKWHILKWHNWSISFFCLGNWRQGCISQKWIRVFLQKNNIS